MKILLLTSWFLVLLLLYLRFQSKWNIRRSMREAEKKKESDTDNYSSDDDDILGKTRTEFPSRGMRGNAKEPDQNRKEKGDSFAVGKSSDPPEKEGVRAAENEDSEFYPSLPENETDEMLEEQEALSLLLEREIEVSTDSLTVKELQRLRTAAEEPEQLTETDKALVRETAGKLRGTEFLEKLRAHERLQRERGRELLGLLSHPPEEMAEKGRKAKKTDSAAPTTTGAQDWMAYL